ncbi:GNAT family N-acetyltransferase [Cohnella sp. JJ-181]|uniref:GNAT family N-acetyltransferase n=1 Tax=Cohnella rhizoplanae TaxID=2974897 RepID=UPI0022FF62EF|nr:GNAT family N-acetyltransferase [Cohnella sp. JJ-181]CAI6039561.1 hypothetical protein COHCIP112018_01028 [Cohnella sp. JJ-181]
MKLERLTVNDAVLLDAFRQDEVPYNLVYRVLDSNEALGWKAEDGRMLFVQTPGYNGWLWVSPGASSAYREDAIGALIERLKDVPLLPGVTAKPGVAEAFAAAYATDRGTGCHPYMTLDAYHCLAVNKPEGVSGALRPADERDLRTIAAFFAGFARDAHGVSADTDSQLQAASGAIGTGNLYLWETDGAVVSIANIAHRSSRHGRINAVYTPPERRNRGFAGALVAELSAMLLRERLTPMLYTNAANPIASRAYRKVGFTEMGSILDIRFGQGGRGE